ncbi:MAG: SpoIIE family protein phosphatase [Ectothiorhodospiraceae bacterium]|nr:SpoIIE family protein phosphatase [Chromatiales bacterium]MCP5156858.1 SpoIIE family protein phosphatase [Ectothiorhodospiraceae bacterium]
MTTRLDIVSRCELFRDVPSGALAQIVDRLSPRRLGAGDLLFAQGDLGDAVYLVVHGTLSLEVDGVSLLYRQPGDCVGEFALIDDGPRSAGARALTDVELLRWERADFRACLERDPSLARGIFKLLTAKLREDVDTKVRMQLERERWQQDLARAREIQTGMLPGAPLLTPALEVAGMCRPAAEVGGDFYDYRELGDGRVAVVVADVTGHGFYSALFVAMAKSCLHASAASAGEPAAMMSALRGTLDLSIGRQLLMTCCYVVIDPVAGRLTYANAGHPFPYLQPAGRSMPQTLESLDPVLGALDDTGPDAFSVRSHRWGPGDLLVLYSDGLTEATDTRGEMFGTARLEAAIRGLAGDGAAAIRDGILRAVQHHARETSRRDDLTLVVACAR